MIGAGGRLRHATGVLKESQGGREAILAELNATREVGEAFKSRIKIWAKDAK
jgi:hypothetical protein